MKGAFSENFVRIDTDVISLKRRDESVIDFTNLDNLLKIKTKNEAKEVVRLLQESMKYLK
ncbi:hypothetical protein MTP04_24150 [Lysinibacillus sp. PLM2]|nr:hypothetical protein MTP04_24150 [Lysinibacillus sp. PLM2]